MSYVLQSKASLLTSSSAHLRYFRIDRDRGRTKDVGSQTRRCPAVPALGYATIRGLRRCLPRHSKKMQRFDGLRYWAEGRILEFLKRGPSPVLCGAISRLL